VNLFVASTALLALLLLFLTIFLTKQPANQIDYPDLAIFVGALIITEWFSVDLYIRDTAVSTSTVPMLAGVLLFGLPAALLFSLVFAAIAMFKHRILLSRFIFNASNQLIGCLLVCNLAICAGVSFSQLNLGLQLIVCLLSSGMLFLSTTALVSLAITINVGQSYWETWKEKFSWLAPSYLAMGLIAFALVFSYQAAGVIGVLIMLIPLYLLRLGQVQYIERTKGMVSELRQKNQALENTTNEIINLNDGLLDTLAEVIDHRDPYVLAHSKKVAQYAVGIAKQMGIHPKQVELIRKACLLHDIGKLGIREAILLKTGTLTKEEFQIIKLHPLFGAKILEATRVMHRFIPIVRNHHERYDGKGYPDGLHGQKIPIEARIVALADAVDAMASDRPYRKAMSMNLIIQEIRDKTGTQFDPQVVEAFIDFHRSYSNETIISPQRINPPKIIGNEELATIQ
jgi:putative nucleotidyltransferase with HDIG domain